MPAEPRGGQGPNEPGVDVSAGGGPPRTGAPAEAITGVTAEMGSYLLQYSGSCVVNTSAAGGGPSAGCGSSAGGGSAARGGNNDTAPGAPASVAIASWQGGKRG